MDRTAVVSLAIGVTGLLAAAVMATVLITDNDDDDGFAATESGFVIEPASSVGPDAFTPSVEVDDGAVCDVDRFLEELIARPDAVREWSRVLGVPESQVASYVGGLEPAVLSEDTAVTNHGLRDGAAYARPSMLVAGTSVLMGTLPTTGVPTAQPPPDTTPTVTEPPPGTTAPATTAGGEEIPVTRCRCGNPLLPAYAPTGGEPTTTTVTTSTTVVDVPTPNDPGEPVSPTPDDPSEPPASGSTPSAPEPSDPSIPDPEPDPYPDDQDQSTPNL